jgi:Lrp/AsnC family transcriptional regulator, leucine-responsive regulatory protein
MDLDLIDVKILRALQEDGRLSNVALAEKVGLSPSPCLRRVRLLEKAGVIAGYRALIDRQEAGLGLTIIVNIKFQLHQTEYEMPFVEAVRAIPEVVSFYLVSGNDDLVLEVVTKDMATYEKSVLKRLLAAPGVKDIRSNFVMRSYRVAGKLPV